MTAQSSQSSQSLGRHILTRRLRQLDKQDGQWTQWSQSSQSLHAPREPRDWTAGAEMSNRRRMWRWPADQYVGHADTLDRLLNGCPDCISTFDAEPRKDDRGIWSQTLRHDPSCPTWRALKAGGGSPAWRYCQRQAGARDGTAPHQPHERRPGE